MYSRITHCLVIGIFLMLLNACAKQDKYAGLWGGKWDDKWPVFITLSNIDPNTYKITYSWLEDTEDDHLTSKNGKCRIEGNHINAKFLFLKVDRNKGMLYGTFGRMANLVKIKSSELPSAAEADAVLRSNGWSKGAIPAEEARKQIQSN